MNRYELNIFEGAFKLSDKLKLMKKYDTPIFIGEELTNLEKAVDRYNTAVKARRSTLVR